MYMRDPRNRWRAEGLPPGYSGQYRGDAFNRDEPESAPQGAHSGESRGREDERRGEHGHSGNDGHSGEHGERRHGGDKSEGGGFLSGLLKPDGRIGKLLSGKWEFEDIILLGMLFLMLRDGIDEDMILIIAIILLV